MHLIACGKNFNIKVLVLFSLHLFPEGSGRTSDISDQWSPLQSSWLSFGIGQCGCL